ncbi:hypothetical protein ACLM5H_15900, partial [Fredinandcohnia humi]
IEPPYTERYVRWCERSGISHPLLLDFLGGFALMVRTVHPLMAFDIFLKNPYTVIVKDLLFSRDV